MQLQVSDELNLVIKYAREEAMRTGSYGIGPDHLFLGLIRQEENAAFRILQNLGVEPAELKAFIDQRIFTNETIPYDQIDHINFSRQAQNVLSIPTTSCWPFAALRRATDRHTSAPAASITGGFLP